MTRMDVSTLDLLKELTYALQMDNLNLRSNLERPPSPSDVSSLTLSLDDIRENIQRLRDEMTASLPPDQLTHP
jgi:hypothetical protein